MKKWMWLTAPIAVVGLALVLWGGAVFAQEAARVPFMHSGNWTGMAGYCQNTTGMMGTGGMMNGGGMMGGFAATGANWTEMQSYCQNATQNGSGMMNGGMMRGGGMMSGGGMMGR